MTLTTIRVHRTWQDVRDLMPAWDELAKRVRACIYLSPTHAEIWWRHYGRGELLIVECRVGEQLVGVLPLFVSVLRAGGLPVRVAKLLVSDSTLAVLSPPLDAAHAEACWAAAIEASLQAGAEVIAFGSLSGEDGHAEEARLAIRAAGLTVLEDRSPVPHSVYKLPPTMEEYYTALEHKHRGKFKRSKRNLLDSGKAEIRVATDSEAPEAFERFVRLHTQRWNLDKLPGHFHDWPGALEYNLETVRSHAARGEALLLEVYLDGELVGADYAFCYGSRAFVRLNARATGESLEKLGLGRVLQVVLFEILLAQGIRHGESGPGHYAYKLQAGGVEFPLMHLVACRSGWLSRVKARALMAWSKLWQYGYYRGWRARILPRLGLMPGPLWRVWIESRL